MKRSHEYIPRSDPSSLPAWRRFGPGMLFALAVCAIVGAGLLWRMRPTSPLLGPNPRRPSPLLPQLNQARGAYLKQEDHSARGLLFEEFTLQLMRVHSGGDVMDWKRILAELGPPDYYRGSSARPEQFAFFYNRFAKRDCIVYVDFDPQGSAVQFAWGPIESSNFTAWRPGSELVGSALRPVTSRSLPARGW
jgi:hypothetical protein